MSQKLNVSIQTTPKELFGSTAYTVSVDVTNPTDMIIEKISVIPQFLPGKLILREEPIHTSLTGLQSEKQSLDRSMEKQAVRAYENQISQGQSRLHQLMSLWMQIIKANTIRLGYGPLHIDIDTEELASGSSEELFRIKSLKDVELLEREIISHENENSRERKLFLLGKEKLLEKMSEIEKKEIAKENLKEEYSIHPGETISYPFEVRAPHLLRAASYSLRFKISYKEPTNDLVATFSEKSEVPFYPSPFATYIGGFFGGLAGFLIKVSLVGSSHLMWFTPAFWSTFAGSIILALVSCAITVRTPNTKKVITTEDLIGGFVLGALVGLFSESILDNIKKLIPTF